MTRFTRHFASSTGCIINLFFCAERVRLGSGSRLLLGGRRIIGSMAAQQEAMLVRIRNNAVGAPENRNI
jgi:hypothetical protein